MKKWSLAGHFIICKLFKNIFTLVLEFKKWWFRILIARIVKRISKEEFYHSDCQEKKEQSQSPVVQAAVSALIFFFIICGPIA